tara:strand:+ start:35 stop:304 length:270 start_codon:yes stop_codon:yes gene_type:complete
MAKITKTKLREVLTTKGLSEGFLGKFFDKLAKDAKSKEIAKAIEKSKKIQAAAQLDIDKLQTKIEAEFIQIYGSLDKVPTGFKKQFNIK